MNTELYKIYRMLPGGESEKAWKAFKQRNEEHVDACKELMTQIGGLTYATDRGGIAGVSFAEIPDKLLWRQTSCGWWLPRAKTNRELYKEFRKDIYATGGWWIFQEMLGCSGLLMHGLTILWPVVKDEKLYVPKDTKWVPKDCVELKMSFEEVAQ